MQNKYESFAVCLDRIIRQRDLTSAQLSRLLGHKSRTTLQRIFSGSAGPDSIRKICAEVCGCASLELTEEEQNALNTSVAVDQVGAHVLQARDEIRSLLRPVSREVSPITVLNGDKTRLLSELTADMSRADYSEVLVLNCSWKAFACELHTLLANIPSGSLNVRHYMTISSDLPRMAAMIGVLRELFGFISYSCYSISDKSNPTDPLAFMGMNAVAARIRWGDDTIREYQLIFSDEHSGVMLEAEGVYAYWEKYLTALNYDARSIKTTYPTVTSAAEYVSFTDTYRQIEENRNIYMFKPDICLNQIPMHIVLDAYRDNTAQIGADVPDFIETLEQLAEIQEARFRNIFNQKKAVHVVFAPSALRKFAKTGLQSDHFYLLRPYTVNERIEILTHLVHQVRTNPYFNIYLLRDEQNFVEMEATCYEGHGVQFTPAHTDYNLSSGHTEAIITNEEFCELFLNFFRDDLLVNHVYSSSAAVFLLESLIWELKNEKSE